MEYQIIPADGREVTEDLLRRFLRTAELLRPGIQFEVIDGNGADPISAKMELPDEPTAKRIINLASIDGFRIVPVPEETSELPNEH